MLQILCLQVNTIGLARVAIDNKLGIIDNNGKLLVTPQFAEIFEFSEGLAAVSIDGKWGYIDRTGKNEDKSPNQTGL